MSTSPSKPRRAFPVMVESVAETASADPLIEDLVVRTATMSLATTVPSWYKIPEISLHDFIVCCKDIYRVIEDQHKSKSSEDPFLKAVVLGHSNLSEEVWHNLERARLTQKALEMKMGDFHEELMGKFPGYETYPNGHETGCDVGKKDGTEVLEIKNRHNTVKGSDGIHIVRRLEEEIESGKMAIFVQVNCPGEKVNRFGTPSTSNIFIWNGQEAYTHLSKRESFFDDLLATVQYVFLHFKTYVALQHLETASPASPSPTPV